MTNGCEPAPYVFEYPDLVNVNHPGVKNTGHR